MTMTRAIYPQTMMLANVMDILLQQPGMDSDAAAFDAMLEIIALELSYEVMIQTPWLKKEILDEVREELDLDLLRSDTWDWFGEVYALRVSQEDFLTDRYDVESLANTFVIKDSFPQPYVLFDYVTGSGRLLLALANRIKNMNLKCPILYYGAEPSLLAYRMAILNFKLHGLDGKVLNVNENQYDIRPFSPNWKYANLWTPTREKRLFTEAETDDLTMQSTVSRPTVYYPKG
jgi:hypothetical protein